MTATTEELIAAYVKIRDKRSEKKKAFEAEDEALKAHLEKLEGHLMLRLQEAGSDSFKTSAGTAYTQVEVQYSCADWTGFWAWIAESGRLDMLEKRVGKKAAMEFEEETGTPPPFLNVSRERKVVVRRA